MIKYYIYIKNSYIPLIKSNKIYLDGLEHDNYGIVDMPCILLIRNNIYKINEYYSNNIYYIDNIKDRLFRRYKFLQADEFF